MVITPDFLMLAGNWAAAAEPTANEGEETPIRAAIAKIAVALTLAIFAPVCDFAALRAVLREFMSMNMSYQ
jgi:hypothetical protein